MSGRPHSVQKFCNCFQAYVFPHKAQERWVSIRLLPPLPHNRTNAVLADEDPLGSWATCRKMLKGGPASEHAVSQRTAAPPEFRQFGAVDRRLGDDGGGEPARGR